MIKLQYVASSGNIYDLNSNGILTREANFHSWAWQASGVALQYGQRLVQFTRDAVTYTADLVLKGPKPQRRAILEALHEDMERDVRLQTPGRLIWQSWYIPCYAVESTTEPQANRTDNTVGFFCPRPFWVRERAIHFETNPDPDEYVSIFTGKFNNVSTTPQTWYTEAPPKVLSLNIGDRARVTLSGTTQSDGTYDLTLASSPGAGMSLYRAANRTYIADGHIKFLFTYPTTIAANDSGADVQVSLDVAVTRADLTGRDLDYPIEYEYDFFKGANGAETIARDFPFAADFKMDIFGPAASPSVYVNGHEYGLDYTIDAGAYATIDSRNNTVVLTQADTTKTNIFDYRKKDSNVFAEIPGGTLSVIWSGEFGFDLTIFEERSEPTW